MIATPALWLSLAAMVPLMIVACYTDLKTLKIPNLVVLLVVVAYLVTGLWGLPTDVFLWRLLAGVIVLFIGYAAWTTGVVGGGDVKMAAAIAPFIVPSDLAVVLLIFSIVSVVLLVMLWIVQRMLGERRTGWMAIDQVGGSVWKRSFPMGLVLGLTTTFYLGLYGLKELGIELV